MAKERQHYVPRFYLESFCNDAGQLHVYDKTTSRRFVSRPDSVAVEKDFYKLPIELTGTGDTRELESALSDVEGDAATIIRSWVDSVGDADFQISLSERTRFSLFIALQMLRTREQREILAEFERRTSTDADGFTADTDLHNHLLWNSDLVQEFADQLADFIWVIAQNTSEVQFLTSDHPVVVKDFTNTNWILAPRLSEVGVQVIIPLTPTLILYCKEPNHWQAVSRFDGCVSPVSFIDYMADHENSGQIGMSTRFVFSSSAQFSIADEYCDAKSPYSRPESRTVYARRHLTRRST